MEAWMRKIWLLFLVMILLLGCAMFPPAITPTPSLVPAVTTPSALPDPTDPSQVLVVKSGQNFDIVLPANASTGYHWQIIGTPDATLLQSTGPNYLSEQPVMPGSGGVEVWTFSALAPGETKIEFGYFPSGDTIQPDETVIFSIRIE
jgi:inhibitor of cysteine peptidase